MNCLSKRIPSDKWHHMKKLFRTYRKINVWIVCGYASIISSFFSFIHSHFALTLCLCRVCDDISKYMCCVPRALQWYVRRTIRLNTVESLRLIGSRIWVGECCVCFCGGYDAHLLNLFGVFLSLVCKTFAFSPHNSICLEGAGGLYLLKIKRMRHCSAYCKCFHMLEVIQDNSFATISFFLLHNLVCHIIFLPVIGDAALSQHTSSFWKHKYFWLSVCIRERQEPTVWLWWHDMFG